MFGMVLSAEEAEERAIKRQQILIKSKQCLKIPKIIKLLDYVKYNSPKFFVILSIYLSYRVLRMFLNLSFFKTGNCQFA